MLGRVAACAPAPMAWGTPRGPWPEDRQAVPTVTPPGIGAPSPITTEPADARPLPPRSTPRAFSAFFWSNSILLGVLSFFDSTESVLEIKLALSEAGPREISEDFLVSGSSIT